MFLLCFTASRGSQELPAKQKTYQKLLLALTKVLPELHASLGHTEAISPQRFQLPGTHLDL